MAGLYVDTAALGRVLLAEPDAEAIRAVMGRYDAWWSSEIVIVELRRLAARANLAAAGESILSHLSQHPIDRGALERASRIEPFVVRSLDAVHLNAAVELRSRGAISAVMTFDRQLHEGCAYHSLLVEAPIS